MLKILGGQLRSRKLKTPHGNNLTRPWTGRARESVMNKLRGHLQDSVVLDLFAGVGTMGLEAISRGAKTVVMVEKDKKIFSILQENIEAITSDEIAIPIQGDALSSIPILRIAKPVDIVFIDPPYKMMMNEASRNRVLEQVNKIGLILDTEGFIVLRTPVNPNTTNHAVDSLGGPEISKEGTGMWILFYCIQPQ